ncbi:MAG: hypothetical protein U1E26_01115 [Coriobacteriia bacterium]|nr:hypothetical protein [Coriobacteriia bacterium]
MGAIIEFIHTWEWTLLVAVIVLEISILVNAVREGKERNHLVREMETTRVELGRESYVAMKRSALLEAGRRLDFISRTANSDLETIGNNGTEHLYKPSVRYRCITATDPSLLRAVFQLHLNGVEVRVSSSVVLSTFRFHTWDDRGAVMGLSAEAEEHEVRGIEAINPHFSRVLRQHFDRIWENSVPWQEWAAALLIDAQGFEDMEPIAELAAQWSLNESDASSLERALAGASN